MAYRKTMLAKVMQWRELTDELSEKFKVPVEGLPAVVQLALQFASEGQQVGFKQAKTTKAPEKETQAPKAKKKYPTRNGRPTKAAKNPPRGMPSSAVEVILKVMKPDEVVSIDDIMDRVIAKNWQPTSTNYRAYVSHLLSKEVNDKKAGVIDHVDVNQYRLRASYVATLGKPAKKPSIIVKAADAKKPGLKKAPVKPESQLNGAAHA